MGAAATSRGIGPNAGPLRNIVSLISYMEEKTNQGYRERLQSALEHVRGRQGIYVTEACDYIEQEVLGPDPYTEPHEYEDCWDVCETCYRPADHNIHNIGPEGP